MIVKVKYMLYYFQNAANEISIEIVEPVVYENLGDLYDYINLADLKKEVELIEKYINALENEDYEFDYENCYWGRENISNRYAGSYVYGFSGDFFEVGDNILDYLYKVPIEVYYEISKEYLKLVNDFKYQKGKPSGIYFMLDEKELEIQQTLFYEGSLC